MAAIGVYGVSIYRCGSFTGGAAFKDVAKRRRSLARLPVKIRSWPLINCRGINNQLSLR